MLTIGMTKRFVCIIQANSSSEASRVSGLKDGPAVEVSGMPRAAHLEYIEAILKPTSSSSASIMVNLTPNLFIQIASAGSPLLLMGLVASQATMIRALLTLDIS